MGRIDTDKFILTTARLGWLDRLNNIQRWQLYQDLEEAGDLHEDSMKALAIFIQANTSPAWRYDEAGDIVKELKRNAMKGGAR